MSWVYNGFLEFVITLIGSVFETISKSFCSIFSLDTSAFFAYIPFANEIMVILKGMGIGIAFLILVMCLLKNILVVITDEYEDSWKVVAKWFVASLIVFYSEQAVRLEFDFMSNFYDRIANIRMFADDMEDRIWDITSFFQNTPAILTLIFLIMIVIHFFKLLLEAAERYIVINLCIVGSPLAMSTFTSKSTSRIFHSFIRLTFSQLLLMVFNLFFIKGATLMMRTAAGEGYAFMNANGEVDGSMVNWMIFLIAFMKAGQAIDSYMRSLGLDVVQTGSSLVNNVMGTAMSAGMTMQRIGNAFGSGGGIGKALSGIKNGGAATMANGVVPPVGGSAAKQAAVNTASQNLNQHMMGKGNLNPDMLYNGIASGMSASGAAAKMAMMGVCPVLNSIPGMAANGAVSLNNGKFTMNMGKGRTAELSTTPPTGKPFMKVPTANGSEMFLSNTGKTPLFGTTPVAGQQMPLNKAMGIANPQMQALSKALNMTPKEMANAGITSSGINTEAFAKAFDLTPEQMQEAGIAENTQNAWQIGEAAGLTAEEMQAAGIDASGQSGIAMDNHAIGQALGLTPEQMEEATVTGIGNNCMEVSIPAPTEADPDNRQVLGTLVAAGADTNLAQGIGTEISGNTLPGSGMVDSYQYIPATSSSLIDSDYVDGMITGDSGIHYDSQSIAETLNDGHSSDRMVVDMQMGTGADGADSLTATYADGTTVNMSATELAAHTLNNTDGYVECHGISDYIDQTSTQEMLDNITQGNPENVSVASFNRNNDKKYSDFKLTDGTDVRVYDASEYSVNGRNVQVVKSENSQGYAVVMTPSGEIKGANVHHRSTSDGKYK